MKNRSSNGGNKSEKIDGPKSVNMKNKYEKKKKNLQRLGGGGLSLEVFANAKSTNSHYNPSSIKKHREFYRNAKYVSKFKRSTKQQNLWNDLTSAIRPLEDENEDGEKSKINRKNKKKSSYSLRKLYEKTREEEDKARIEREAIVQAKKEQREKVEAQRKATREKMFKKTRYGQPVMKYRIEQLLQTIQGSSEKSFNRNT
ncbi:rRNA_processing domain-containing protein [Cephalotus follicularis]|uniref:rRNA_processing domain-containing protein n=1 Tax=Cephalotus follicularis TaxID=3775 RepID=A0A1Q3BHC7_CEPFO|nr:rRNA_processing domain-containing protein [Cephalotus follicularis]